MIFGKDSKVSEDFKRITSCVNSDLESFFENLVVKSGMKKSHNSLIRIFLFFVHLSDKSSKSNYILSKEDLYLLVTFLNQLYALNTSNIKPTVSEFQVILNYIFDDNVIDLNVSTSQTTFSGYSKEFLDLMRSIIGRQEMEIHENFGRDEEKNVLKYIKGSDINSLEDFIRHMIFSTIIKQRFPDYSYLMNINFQHIKSISKKELDGLDILFNIINVNLLPFVQYIMKNYMPDRDSDRQSYYKFIWNLCSFIDQKMLCDRGSNSLTDLNEDLRIIYRFLANNNITSTHSSKAETDDVTHNYIDQEGSHIMGEFKNISRFSDARLVKDFIASGKVKLTKELIINLNKQLSQRKCAPVHELYNDITISKINFSMNQFLFLDNSVLGVLNARKNVEQYIERYPQIVLFLANFSRIDNHEEFNDRFIRCLESLNKIGHDISIPAIIILKKYYNKPLYRAFMNSSLKDYLLRYNDKNMHLDPYINYVETFFEKQIKEHPFLRFYS